MSVSSRKETDPHGEREKISDRLRWGLNPRPLEQIIVALPTELQDQMGAGHGKLSSYIGSLRQMISVLLNKYFLREAF